MGRITRDLRRRCGRQRRVRRSRGVSALTVTKTPDAALDFDPEHRVGHLLRRAAQRANIRTSERLRDLGITPVQAATVMALHRSGASSQADLGRAIGMEPGNVHTLLARMTKLGWVASQPHPTDQRQMLVTLSAFGERRAGDIARLTAASAEATLAPLTAREREVLLELLQRIAL